MNAYQCPECKKCFTENSNHGCISGEMISGERLASYYLYLKWNKMIVDERDKLAKIAEDYNREKKNDEPKSIR